MKTQQEECPKCHQFKVVSKKEYFLMMAAVSVFAFFISSIFAIILIGIPFMIMFLIVGIVSLVLAFRPKAKHMKQCRACGYKFDDRELKSVETKA